MSTSTAIETDMDIRPETADPEMLYEIVDGIYVELPSMGFGSSLVAQAIFELLSPFVRANRLGITSIEAVYHLHTLPGRQKRRPDVAFLSAGRWPLDRRIPGRGDMRAVPDLAIEVLSPEDRDAEVQRKLRDYFRAGVTQVWHVRPPERAINVFDSMAVMRRYEAEDEIDGGPIVPGFRFKVGSIFPETVEVDDEEQGHALAELI